MLRYTFELDTNKEEKETKCYWITMNTVLNGLSIPDYNWLEEAKMWAKQEFPDLTWEQVVEIAKKYPFWSDFEKIWQD